MEHWLIYGILAYFLWALTSIVDKVFLNRYFKNPIVYCVCGGVFQIVVLLAIPLFGFSPLSMQEILFGLGAGALFFLGLLPYFKALSQDDATIVVPLGSLTPVIVLIASLVFLGEHLDNRQIAAFGLFVVGGFLLSVKEFSFQKVRLTPALKWVIPSMLLFSAALILTKMTFIRVPFFEGFILLRAGSFATALGFFSRKNFRKIARETYRSLNGKAKMTFVANQGLGIAGQLFFNGAIATGSLSLLNAAQGIQYVFLFVMSIILSLYLPKIFSEDMGKGDFARRGAAILFIVAAIYLVNG